MRKVRALLVVLTLAAVFCLPVRQANADDERFEIIFTFYSDYFSTYAGSYGQFCDYGEFSDGTLDGAYKTKDWTNCVTLQHHVACYQKVGASWQVISCP